MKVTTNKFCWKKCGKIRISSIVGRNAHIKEYWGKMLLEINKIVEHKLPFLPESVLLGVWPDTSCKKESKDLMLLLLIIVRLLLAIKWKENMILTV